MPPSLQSYHCLSVCHHNATQQTTSMQSNSSFIQNKPPKATIIEGKPSRDVMHHCKHPAVIDPLPDQNTHLLIITYIVQSLKPPIRSGMSNAPCLMPQAQHTLEAPHFLNSWDIRRFRLIFRVEMTPVGVDDMGVSKNRGTPKWMVYNGKPY